MLATVDVVDFGTGQVHSNFYLDAAGRAKGKCVMGQRADCDRCGCVVPYYLRSLTGDDLPDTVADLVRMDGGEAVIPNLPVIQRMVESAWSAIER